MQTEITRRENYYNLKLYVCFTELIHISCLLYSIHSSVAVAAEKTKTAIKNFNVLFSYPTSPTAQWLKMEL